MWNRITVLMTLVTLGSLLISPFEVDARGGGRGGGGRGGGGGGRGGGGGSRGGGGSAYRGGNSINRTPSMSRPSTRPSQSYGRQQIQSRPSSSRPSSGLSDYQGRGGQSAERLQQKPSSANRQELRNQVNQHVQNRPAQNIDKQSLGQRTQDFSNLRNNQLIQNREISNKVSDRMRQTRPDYNHWFDRDFFHRHDIDVGYVGDGINWWRGAGWATLATWGAWNWATPYYYDYQGNAYPITVSDSSYVYPYPTTTTSYVVSEPTTSYAAVEPTGGDWLPLGVFAVGSDVNAVAQTNRFIQLAINKSGEIAGVFYNSTTDQAHDLVGMVDPANQKAYWYLENYTGSPVVSTGIYNLTEEQTAVNVEFSGGVTQQWILVRLQQ